MKGAAFARRCTFWVRFALAYIAHCARVCAFLALVKISATLGEKYSANMSGKRMRGMYARVSVFVAEERGARARDGERECWIDGSVAPSGASGIAVWYGYGHRLNYASASSRATGDNNEAEMLALYAALTRHGRDDDLVARTDSRAVCKAMERVKRGDFARGTSRVVLACAYALWRRRGRTVVRKVKAHSGGAHTNNARADQLALVGARSSASEDVTGGFLPQATKSLFHVDVARALIRLERGLEAHGNGCIDGNEARGRSQKEVDAQVKKMERATLTRPKPWNDSFELTPIVALDCEMVGVGEDGIESMLAQVCVINEHGNILYCSYSRAYKTVTDYRTHVSGILPHHIDSEAGSRAAPFAQVQSAVRDLIANRIVVGHALENDFKALKLTHPRDAVRDTAKWRPLLRPPRFHRPRRLRHLARDFCALSIQCGDSHDPAEDALAALAVYKRFRASWEGQIQSAALGRANARAPLVDHASFNDVDA